MGVADIFREVFLELGLKGCGGVFWIFVLRSCEFKARERVVTHFCVGGGGKKELNIF